MDVTSEMTNQNLRGIKSPLLKREEILRCMNEVDIHLTEAELAEPNRHRDSIREVMVGVLKYYWGAPDGDDFRSVPQCVLDAQSSDSIDKPELHESSVVDMKLFRALVSMMRECGYNDFGLRDLGHPDPKRLRRQLSAAINFMKYREDNYEKVHSSMEQRVDILEAYEEISKNNEDAKMALEQAENDECANSEEIKAVAAECGWMEKELSNLNLIQAATRQEGAELKKMSAEIRDKIAIASIALREIQAEERKLSSQVVDSPDQIRTTLAHARERCVAAKRSVDEKEEEARQMRRSAEHAVNGAGDVERATDALEVLRASTEESGRIEEELDGTKDRASALEVEVREHEEEKEEYDEQLRGIETEMDETLTMLRDEIQTIEDDLDAAKQELGGVEQERAEGRARLETVEVEIRKIEGAIEEDRRKADDEIAHRIESFHRLEKYVLEKENQRVENICNEASLSDKCSHLKIV